jgi:glycosyltransferase involved in cell wall biosynthesis
VVVDDGSTDATQQVVTTLAMPGGIDMRYITQPKRGGGAARNRGLREANGEIVLMIDDDIIASPALVAEHLRAHAVHPEANTAILGYVALSPELPSTPANLHHAVSMWESLRDGQEVDWRRFLTGNTSVKRSFLLNNDLFFDESLPCFQDTELGYRCWKQGMRIIYNARAPGQHYHDLSFEGTLRLNRKYGEALAIVHHKHPELRHELGDYMVFSWGNGPRRVLHDLFRPAVLNWLTVGGLLLLARRWQASGRKTPYAVSRRIGNYYERKGYQRKRRELERSRW